LGVGGVGSESNWPHDLGARGLGALRHSSRNWKLLSRDALSFPIAPPCSIRMKIFVTTLFLIAIAAGCIAEEPQHNYVPKDGYVPTEDVAIKIAIAILEPICGAAQIASEKPYHATLTNGIWTVTGSLPGHKVGGVAIAEIAKSDGRVIRVSHGR